VGREGSPMMAETGCPKAKDGRHRWRDIGTKSDPGGKDVRCMLCGVPNDPATLSGTESPPKPSP
jgi:hypothetical protein